MDYIESLLHRAKLLRKVIKFADKDIEKAPEGQLHYKIVGVNDIRFYRRSSPTDTNGTYLGKADNQPVLIRKLAQKYYAEKMKKAAERELTAIDNCLRKVSENAKSRKIEEVNAQLCLHLWPLTMRYIETDEEFARNWQNEPFKYFNYKEECKQFITLRGEKVRSKSEEIIANILFHYNIPYRYECPLRIGRHKYHPDFTILDVRRRKVFYWEHLGKIDDPKYAEEAIMRIANYCSCGCGIGTDLVITCESGSAPFDTVNVTNILAFRGLISWPQSGDQWAARSSGSEFTAAG